MVVLHLCCSVLSGCNLSHWWFIISYFCYKSVCKVKSCLTRVDWVNLVICVRKEWLMCKIHLEGSTIVIGKSLSVVQSSKCRSLVRYNHYKSLHFFFLAFIIVNLLLFIFDLALFIVIILSKELLFHKK